MAMTAAAVAAVSCSSAGSDVRLRGRSDGEKSPVTVRVMEIRETAGTGLYSYVGTAKASKSAYVSCPYPGRLAKLNVSEGGRVLVTTLTKKMAESLTDYLKEHHLKVEYMHSDIDTLDRIDIINRLRRGDIDVIVGINLLREGLDIPEVVLVAILDADKEGFLRSKTSLIQTIGRAARNKDARVIMYADTVTGSMKEALAETDRRRNKQIAYNTEHGITPRTIVKPIVNTLQISKKRQKTPALQAL